MSWEAPSLFLSDPDGNVYEITGEVLAQCRVDDARKSSIVASATGGGDDVSGYCFGLFTPPGSTADSGGLGINTNSISQQGWAVGTGVSFNTFGAASSGGQWSFLVR